MVDATCRIIDSFVRRKTSPILEQILNCCHSEHEQQREHCNFFAEHIEFRHPVEELYEDEVEIGDPMKLLDEIFWQKAEQRVLGGANLVLGVATVRMITLWRLWRHKMIRHDMSKAVLLKLATFEEEKTFPPCRQVLSSQRINRLGT